MIFTHFALLIRRYSSVLTIAMIMRLGCGCFSRFRFSLLSAGEHVKFAPAHVTGGQECALCLAQVPPMQGSSQE